MNLCVSFQPITQIVQTALNGSGGSGLYWVNTHGKKMHSFKNKPGYLGSLKNSNGTVGGGQAVLQQIPFDPTMMCMAFSLMSIEQKLDEICEIQKEILAFLEMKEKAKLKGNLNTLYDVLNNFKYNTDNEKLLKIIKLCEDTAKYGTQENYAGAGDYVTSVCSTCHGSRTCRTCGGSGKR